MTRREVELAQAAWFRSLSDIREIIREHNQRLSPMLQRAAQLEDVYFRAKNDLHAELDAQRR